MFSIFAYIMSRVTHSYGFRVVYQFQAAHDHIFFYAYPGPVPELSFLSAPYI